MEETELTPLNSSNSNSLFAQKPRLDYDWLLDSTIKNKLIEQDLFRIDGKDLTAKRLFGKEPRNILTIAVLDSKVTSNTLKILFDYTLNKHGNLNLMEETWYYWEPIHFASHQVNFDKLSIVVELLRDTKKLNALTLFSENALHVLLEYGRQQNEQNRIDSFDVQLSNGWESRICHVIAEEKNDVVQCAKLIIDAGIDINHNNIWNETPIIIAIRYRLLQVIKLLLGKKEIDLDTCKDSITGKSARDLLRENEICLELISANTIMVPPVKVLFGYLKNRDEEMFLRYNNENIRQYVTKLDGNYEEITSGTMLQLCLTKGFTDFVKESPASHQDTDILKSPMLKFFCKHGFGRCVEHLLNNGALITQKTRMFSNRDVFHMAIKLNYYPFLAILLEHGSRQVNESRVTEALDYAANNSFRSDNHDSKHVLYLLVSKLEAFHEDSPPSEIKSDKKRILNQILSLYLENNNSGDEYKENICQVLRLGASLADENLKQISYDTLEAHLDECIGSDNTVRYDSFIKNNAEEYSEIETLHRLTHDQRKCDLLNHPALIYFVYNKWLKTSKLFYLNLTFYFAFLLFLYCYMIQLQRNVRFTWLSATFYVLYFIQFFKEFLQLILYCPKYFYDPSNYLELTVLACCFYNFYVENAQSMIVAILLSTSMFLLMLGQLPRFTKYMIIFSSTKYFLEYAAFYLLQFVSFALCFHILLPEPQPDENGGKQPNLFEIIFIRFFNSLIFFIGQYDGDISNPPKYPIFGRIVVAMFIFCMTIILNNLLVGLIVTDMDVIQKNSKLQRQIKMIRSIARIEKFLKRIEKFCGLNFVKRHFNTRIFDEDEQKVVKIDELAGTYDEDDKMRLKKIQESCGKSRNGLSNLYDYIVSEIYIDQKSVKENRDILYKLSRLEEQLRRNHFR